MPHQIYTIVRCLEDKPIRFLLADEVGLGKTIEACSVIKILKSQYHKLRVLLIIPNSLVDQWKTELLYKFNISAQIFDSSAQESDSIIVPLEELNQCRKKIESLQAFDFCIVDESHRLLALPQEYLAVKEISKRISNILLLSATPVQENKEEYLSLLTLLHPEQYENMAIEYFVELLSKQQEIQRRVYSILGDLEEYDDYYEEIIEELSSIANKINDSTFLALVERISVDLPDKGLDAAQLSVAYLCEHYRIERRVIRNRREAIREKLPERDMIAVPYEMVGSEVFYYEENTYELVLSWIQSIDAFDKDKVLGVVTLIAGLLLFSDW